MKTLSATEFKRSFNKILDSIQKEPILVTKKGRPIGIFFSMDAISKLAIGNEKMEDFLFGETTKLAIKEGFSTEEESEKLLNKI